MSTVITPTAAVVQVAAASAATQQLVLQPGTVIDARVLAVQDNLARVLIAGLTLDVLTEVALQPGANLKLAVSQTAEGVVRLAVLPQTGATQGRGQTSASSANGAAAAVAGNATSAAAGAAAGVNSSTQSQLPRVASASLAPASPEAIAISQAVQSAAPRQAGLAPLFANLPVIVAAPSVPQQVQSAAATLLAARPALDGALTSNDLRQAFQKSGLLLEATLATGTAPAGPPDLKAALVVFKQVLSTWLAQGTALQTAPAAPAAVPPQTAVVAQSSGQTVPQTLQQATVRAGTIAELPVGPALVAGAASVDPAVLRGQAAATRADVLPDLQAPVSGSPQPVGRELPELPGQALRTAATVPPDDAATTSPRQTHEEPAGASVTKPAAHPLNQQTPLRHASEAAPPFRGALPSPQPVAAPTIAHDTATASMGRQLLEQTDAAIARQTLLQVASLPDRPELGGANQSTQPRWSFEIPFATPQGTAMAQFEISRDGGGNDAEAAAPSRIWRARFTLDVEPAGPVHALVSLVGEKTAVRMWAERPETAAQLRAGAEQLGHALRQAELEPGDILVGEGAPPQPKTRAGRFLDRAT